MHYHTVTRLLPCLMVEHLLVSLLGPFQKASRSTTDITSIVLFLVILFMKILICNYLFHVTIIKCLLNKI